MKFLQFSIHTHTYIHTNLYIAKIVETNQRRLHALDICLMLLCKVCDTVYTYMKFVKFDNVSKYL